MSGARVKRRGKGPPLDEQSARHGKPHREQGQIGNPGAARSTTQVGFRVLAAQTNDSLRSARSADKIRLTALPKSAPKLASFFFEPGCQSYPLTSASRGRAVVTSGPWQCLDNSSEQMFHFWK